MNQASESQTYQAMLAEVEEIVQKISGDQYNLDEMVERVEHGYVLIKTMRERLETTKMKIEKLRDKFTDESAE